MLSGMRKWTVEEAKAWEQTSGWRVGCNFLPSSAINQLEMWQADTWDAGTIDRELGWAQDLGFSLLRVYLHDLAWTNDRAGFLHRMEEFLGIAHRHGQTVVFVFFDDCHRPDPLPGRQPQPVRGVHNSGWKHSPGQAVVQQFHAGRLPLDETTRLHDYVTDVLRQFEGDSRVWMWDLYNEPGQSGNGDLSLPLLKAVWEWARSVRPSQPLTSCLDGSIGAGNLRWNAENSDIITFHCYGGNELEPLIRHHLQRHLGRTVVCTEYMARELGTTFQHSLPIFKNYGISCCNWGLVAGKSQTHFNWETVRHLEELRQRGEWIQPGDPIPEPPLWFHDIFRQNGTPFDAAEIRCIRAMTRE